MSATPETGTLVLADITGYTAYLSGGEIEHAPVIAGDLLETIVGRLEPPFRLAKLEGDAAFLYVEDGRADASLQLDAIEAAYLAFRRRLRSIDTATACDCNACQLAPRLDLKLFVHHGSFVRSRIAGRDELAGTDVILAHRLLKGAVATERGAGFAQFTAAAAAALDLDPGATEMAVVRESFEHVGSTDTFVLDLDARWQAESERRRVELGEAASLLDLSVECPAAPADVWAYLTSPGLRPRWEGPIVIDEATVGGWRGIGTTTRCVTGRLATLEEIVDWQPYDHVAWRLTVPGVGAVDATADLSQAGDATSVRLRWSSAVPVAAETIASIRDERGAALGRLATALEVRPS